MAEICNLGLFFSVCFLLLHLKKECFGQRKGGNAETKWFSGVSVSGYSTDTHPRIVIDMRHCKQLQRSQSQSVELIFAPLLEKISGLTLVPNRR